MANEQEKQVLEDVAAAIADAEVQIPLAENFVQLLKDAGEDFTDAGALVIEAKAKVANWKRTLAKRGIEVPAPPVEEE